MFVFSSLNTGSMTIHRRATKWEHGEVPETLLTLAREHGPRAVSWNALARSGRSGYKHVGLELEVVDSEPPEDVAGAILQMVTEYGATNGVDLFRVDAYDASGARLGDMVLRIGEGGVADEVEAGPGGGARWALKALNDIHQRYVGTLDALTKMVEMVAGCLEAMGGAVASAAQTRMEFAAGEAERDAAAHTHEKQMRLLELLAAHIGADRTKHAGSSPLATLLATMPDDVRETLRSILGDLYGDMLKAVHTSDPEIRREQLTACISRVSPSQKMEMGDRIPEEWRVKLLAAWRAELA